MNKIITAVIVDDERLARQVLKEKLKEFPNIEIIGEANNIDTAIETIVRLKPALVFLDIQMPGENGFDLFEKMDMNCKVIFVTAFDSYAIRAFEVNALDYLLKPIDQNRLKQSINRIQNNDESKIESNYKFNYDDKILLSSSPKIKFIKLSSIKSISSSGDFTIVNLESGQKQITNFTMNNWEEKLPTNDFCRIHRSTIININYIERIEKWLNGSFKLYLYNTTNSLMISKRFALKLKNSYSFLKN